MGKFVQLVMGPAGVGKSTYCKTMQEHCANAKRSLHVANLDPAAEFFEYSASFDIRDLICLEDVMDELGYGPNGGLVYCMEYLMQNSDWLKDELDSFAEDDYVILDCPGQVELYSHLPLMHDLAHLLNMWGYQVVSVYLLDALCVLEPSKFISGCLLSLSCMLQLELPHINVVTKCDLVDKSEIEAILESESTSMIYRLNNANPHAGLAVPGLAEFEQAQRELTGQVREPNEEVIPQMATSLSLNRNTTTPGGSKDAKMFSSGKLRGLTEAIGSVVDDYMMVSFVMMDPNDEESLEEVLAHTDHAVQYGEDLEPKDRGGDCDEDCDENNNSEGADYGAGDFYDDNI